MKFVKMLIKWAFTWNYTQKLIKIKKYYLHFDPLKIKKTDNLI